jgi:hypothetical protein
MKPARTKRERFAGRYDRQAATVYEEVRRDQKWDLEERVFDELYERVRPRTVLDCPVGTGRFIDRYARDGVRALGVDLSDHMLAEAARKIPAGADIRLVKGDVLDPGGSAALGRDHDLIVCVRFVYAVARRDLPILFRNFAATGARHLLVGVRMWGEGGSALKPLVWRLWNASKHRPRWPFGRQRYVPSERELLRVFGDAGWDVVERRTISEERESFGRYFYLLRRTSRP